ncbi:MAG: carotenoid biosynthesis protein [Chloroflexi bacterium]|nr:carotenoid biosynthesis protein [Chloroflexota bacterium]
MTTLVTRLMSLQLPRTALPQTVLIAAWFLSMVSLPIALWTVGEQAIVYGTIASVLLLVSATCVIIAQAWGWRRALLSAVIVALLGWSIEFVGSKTGFPFGRYSYTSALQPQLLGVPLLIPLAWLMMMPPAWAVAQCLIGSLETPPRRAAFVGLSALAFTAWDLYLDPQMVNWGFWVWHEPGALHYFGIPLVNYMGWILAALLMTAAVRPPRLPRRAIVPLLAIYGITIFLQTIGVGLLWGMPGPALCGFAAMGTLLLLTVRRLRAS